MGWGPTKTFQMYTIILYFQDKYHISIQNQVSINQVMIHTCNMIWKKPDYTINIHFLLIQIRNISMIDTHFPVSISLVLKIPFTYYLLLHQFGILINSYDPTVPGLQTLQPHMQKLNLFAHLEISRFSYYTWICNLYPPHPLNGSLNCCVFNERYCKYYKWSGKWCHVT